MRKERIKVKYRIVMGGFSRIMPYFMGIVI